MSGKGKRKFQGHKEAHTKVWCTKIPPPTLHPTHVFERGTETAEAHGTARERLAASGTGIHVGPLRCPDGAPVDRCVRRDALVAKVAAHKHLQQKKSASVSTDK